MTKSLSYLLGLIFACNMAQAQDRIVASRACYASAVGPQSFITPSHCLDISRSKVVLSAYGELNIVRQHKTSKSQEDLIVVDVKESVFKEFLKMENLDDDQGSLSFAEGVDRRECRIIKVDRVLNYFSYSCSGYPGLSGAVLYQGKKAVGIHLGTQIDKGIGIAAMKGGIQADLLTELGGDFRPERGFSCCKKLKGAIDKGGKIISDGATAVYDAAKDVEATARKAAEDSARAAEKAARDTSEVLKKAAHDTEVAAQKAAHDAQVAINKAAEDTKAEAKRQDNLVKAIEDTKAQIRRSEDDIKKLPKVLSVEHIQDSVKSVDFGKLPKVDLGVDLKDLSIKKLGDETDKFYKRTLGHFFVRVGVELENAWDYVATHWGCGPFGCKTDCSDDHDDVDAMKQCIKGLESNIAQQQLKKKNQVLRFDQYLEQQKEILGVSP